MSKDDSKYRDNVYHEYATNFQDSEKNSMRIVLQSGGLHTIAIYGIGCLIIRR